MIANPVVNEAMRLLSERINLVTGLTHPSDKSAAVGLLRSLLMAGERYEPGELRTWALENGWSSRAANQLYEVADAICDGRTVRTSSSGGWKPNIVDRLREKVSSK